MSITPSKPVDEVFVSESAEFIVLKYFVFKEEDNVESDTPLVRPLPAISHHSIMYAPKCLVLVSRLDYIETFRVRYLISFCVY